MRALSEKGVGEAERIASLEMKLRSSEPKVSFYILLTCIII